jgi:excinuclease UvrABC nuclease subunit
MTRVTINYVTDKISDFIKVDDFELKIEGVYLLYDESKELLYIGQTNNMAQRVKSHISKFITTDRNMYLVRKNLMSEQYYYVRYFEINEKAIRSCVEEKLIKELDPHFNIEYKTSTFSQRYLALDEKAKDIWSMKLNGKSYEDTMSDIYMNL